MTPPPRVSRRWPAGLAAVLLACGPDEGPRTHVVTIDRFQYAPGSLAVAAGDTVVWENRDLVPHTATSPAMKLETGSLAPGQSARSVAARKGTHEYICRFHPAMTARVSVR